MVMRIHQWKQESVAGIRIFADGAGYNGEVSRYCVVLEGIDSPIVFETKENKTNNEMEYRAVIHALKLARKGDHIMTDSQLVVNQVKGEWKINKEHLQPLCNKAQKLLKSSGAKLSWIRRERSKAGHILDKLKGGGKIEDVINQKPDIPIIRKF